MKRCLWIVSMAIVVMSIVTSCIMWRHGRMHPKYRSYENQTKYDIEVYEYDSDTNTPEIKYIIPAGCSTVMEDELLFSNRALVLFRYGDRTAQLDRQELEFNITGHSQEIGRDGDYIYYKYTFTEEDLNLLSKQRAVYIYKTDQSISGEVYIQCYDDSVSETEPYSTLKIVNHHGDYDSYGYWTLYPFTPPFDEDNYEPVDMSHCRIVITNGDNVVEQRFSDFEGTLFDPDLYWIETIGLISVGEYIITADFFASNGQ